MNEIKVLINFEKRIIDTRGVCLTENDYNSTKIVFDFDRQDGTKIFELKNPKNELVFSKEIVNNEVILAKENEDGTYSSIFGMAGQYTFEVSLYADEGKLTSDYDYLYVELEQVVIGDEVVDVYLPIFDELMQKINTAITETDNLDIDIQDNVVTITKKDGTVKSENVKGDAYVITDEDMQEIETNVRNDIQPILDETKENSETAISISKGANQALSFGDYTTMISVFNSLNNDVYRTGQNVLIVTLNVPDLWVSEITEENIEYQYTTDENFTALLKEQGYVQIGYYKLSALETQKVDLTDYLKNTDYATSSKAGAVMVDGSLGVTCGYVSSGKLNIMKATDTEIDAKKSLYKPIVPANLDYAVGSVKASETQSGSAKMWTSTNEDGEIGLNISTEV